MTETTIRGRRVRLLESWEAPGLVLDRWEDPAEPCGSWRSIGVVVLVTDGGSHSVDEDPNMPWGDTWAMGYTPYPSEDPVERFREAIRQERERAAERLGGPITWEQIGPSGAPE